MRENKTCPYEGWQQLPTQELDQILQAELEKDHPSQEVVLPILQIIEEREKGFPVEKTPEVLTVLDKLSKHKAPTKQPYDRRPWIAGIAALAAVICIVVMAMPQTVGAESIMDVLVRWTSSIFEFIDPDKRLPKTNGEFTTDNPGLQQLYDKVTELGITDPVVPMWLPDDFALTELKELPVAGGTKVYGKFENGGNDISITYRISTDTTTSFEKEGSAVEVFEAGDVSHFIMDNVEKLSATWAVGGVECLLNTNIAKEDLYMTIKSIYRSELTE